MQAPLSTMSARSVAGSSVSGSSSKGRAADHMLFYSVCQATFYVMCFRGDELAAMDGFSDQVQGASVLFFITFFLFFDGVRGLYSKSIHSFRLRQVVLSGIGDTLPTGQGWLFRLMMVRLVGFTQAVHVVANTSSQRI